MARQRLNAFLRLLEPFADAIKVDELEDDQHLYTVTFPTRPGEQPNYLAIKWMHSEVDDVMAGIIVNTARASDEYNWMHLEEAAEIGGEHHYLNYVLDKREITAGHGLLKMYASLIVLPVFDDDGSSMVFTVVRLSVTDKRVFTQDKVVTQLMMSAFRGSDVGLPLIDRLQDIDDAAMIIHQIIRTEGGRL